MDLFKDLLQLDLGELYRRFCTFDEAGKLPYGMLPFMALAHLGSDLAASYVERVNSVARDVMPEGSTLLGDLPLEMFTVKNECRLHFIL